MPVFDEEQYIKHYGILRRSGRYPWGSGGNDLSEATDFHSALMILRSRTGDEKMTDEEIARVFGMTEAELRMNTAIAVAHAKTPGKKIDDVEIAKAFGITPEEVQSSVALEALRTKASGKKMTDTEIARVFGMSRNDLAANVALANAIIKQNRIEIAQGFKSDGDGATAIGKKMGLSESTVRDLLSPGADAKRQQLEMIADAIKKRVDESDGYIDVGSGSEHHLEVTKTKMDVALSMLKSEGYVVATVLQPSATTTNDTRVRVVAKPGETWSSINHNRHLIQGIGLFSNDKGQSLTSVQEPLQLDPSRVSVKYGDKGGAEADGTIYVRSGVPDLSLKGSSYAQVRIAVGKNHYLKGMAVMKDDLPAGVDVEFHTNKVSTGNKLDAMKEVNKGGSPIERFGAIFRQVTDDATGKVTSHLNIVNDEEDWADWSKSLATQMLSKQKPDFVKRQLDVTYAEKRAKLDEIMSLTNPVVKKELLKAYADDMDASSVHLKAAALPRQKTHVILPIRSLKDDEVYAPNYNDGERVVLIRYPHGGKFEIPELTVNNRNREARKIMPANKTSAAIGINSEVAKRLSGADFDGDTVVVIPNNRRQIQNEPPLAKLKNFDPQMEYRGLDPKTKKPLPGVTLMTNTQTQMGTITNLINDMTLGGANHEELTRAVRHSMVVIDAEKHGLDYKRSEKENNIKALKKRYQPGKYGGASTIISRVGRKTEVPEFKLRTKSEGGGIDPKTGEPIYVPTGRTRPRPIKNKEGDVVGWEKVPRTVKVKTGDRVPGITIVDPKTGERRPVRDAYDLVSGPGDMPKRSRGTVVERHYAEYSNKVRDLANAARLAEDRIPNPKVNPAAKKAYAKEVASLNRKLKDLETNRPLERQAQTLAGVIIKMKQADNPGMTSEQLKRVKTNAIRYTREQVGAHPQRIKITPREWEAVQNYAVPHTTLREVLRKADMDEVRQLAQPRSSLKMQPQNITLAKVLMASGNYTRAEIAERFGVSLSTLDRSVK